MLNNWLKVKLAKVRNWPKVDIICSWGNLAFAGRAQENCTTHECAIDSLVFGEGECAPQRTYGCN